MKPVTTGSVRTNRCWLAVVAVVLLRGLGSPEASSQPQSQRAVSRQKINDFMRTLNQRGQFNGAVLVGDADGILYESGFGQANRPHASKFTTETKSCLASVSKPFTALAVMMLVQSGSIHLDDSVSKYVEGLKQPVGAVTIRQLLTHTSDHKPKDAIKVFALNANEHPSSSNAFDSLAEAYRASGDATAAKTNYEKALALDPTNEHARTALAQLK